MTVHTLKVAPQFWPSVVNDARPFEVRRDDRGFKVGDIVRLKHRDSGAWGTPESEQEVRKITYILKSEDLPNALAPGYVVLGFGYFDDE